MCFLVNIAKLFDSKPPVASVDLLFLIKSNVGWFLLQRVDLVIVRVIYTLLVETIPTCFYWLTCKNEKLVQNKPLQQRLFDLILGFWHFFDILIANVSWTVAQTLQNCRKCFFLDNLQTITQERSMKTRQMTPFLSTFSPLPVYKIHLYIWKWSRFIFLYSPPSPFGLFCSVKYLNFEQKLPIWTAHHIFLESRQPEVTKIHIMFCPPRGARKRYQLMD